MSSRIPKVIHYCWFGGKPLPPLAEKCIASWRKFLPDYEIKRWDESNFDVSIVPFTKEAYEAKKYAFVSDYARLWIIHKYGGLYFDTDVEIIKDMHQIIEAGAFMGCENLPQNSDPSSLGVNPGLGIGAEKNNPFYSKMLEKYKSIHFDIQKPVTIVTYTTEALVEDGLKSLNIPQSAGGLTVYPKEYFCPIDYKTKKLNITSKTVSIHHFMESWKTPWNILKYRLLRLLGDNISNKLVKAKSIFKGKK